MHDKSVLVPTNISSDDEEDTDVLPESVSITRVDDLLAQMRFHEVPKRALFSIPFELAKDFVIGVKGLVSSLRYTSTPLIGVNFSDTVW